MRPACTISGCRMCVYAEPFALSPDTKALLEQMGYPIQEQKPWGAVALIAGPELPPPSGAVAMTAAANHSRNDTALPCAWRSISAAN